MALVSFIKDCTGSFRRGEKSFYRQEEPFFNRKEWLRKGKERVRKQKVSIDEQLLKAQTVIKSSLEDSEILKSVSAYGYDEAKLNTGKGLLDEVNALHLKQKK